MNGNVELHGTLPSAITTLTNLLNLELQSTSLDGEIPIGFWNNLSQLQILDLSHTQLQGTIGTEIGQWLDLKVLSLDNAKFYGTIPKEMGLLTKLDHGHLPW